MEKKENKIGQDFTMWGLALFALPSFFTNFFAQLFQSLDDGLFISRYVGETALASLNLLNPLVGVRFGLENLFSLGAATISAKLMGEGKQEEAKRVFTRVFVAGGVFFAIFSLLINIFNYPILKFLGAEGELTGYATYQMRLVMSFAPITCFNNIFNCYYSTAGKPKMGMYASVLNGVINIGLDIILMAILKMGVIGACIATTAGNIAVFFLGLVFFMNKNNEIHFVKPKGKFISTSIESGKYALPQCVNSVSFGITAYISNIVILNMIGSTGVAANAIVSDVRKMLTSGLIGFSVCVGPVIAYNRGLKDKLRLKKMLSHVAKLWFLGSLLLTTIGLILRKPLISIFMSEVSTKEFYDLSYYALTIEIFATAFVAGCITTNRSFIALGNPKAGIILSVFRNLIFKSVIYIVLPMLMGTDGIWYAVTVSEGISFFFGVYLLYLNRDNYGYGKSGIAKKLEE